MSVQHIEPAEGKVVRTRTLVHFGLSYSETVAILAVCAPFRPSDVPPWLFREILIRGLAADSARLAFKIGMMDDDQFESLYQYIEAAHSLTWPLECGSVNDVD